MRKFNEENERIKRKYSQYLREAKRMDHKTVQKAEDAILKFEASTGFKSFKLFHIEQAVAFKAKFENEISKTTGKPLAKETIAATLTALKKFFFWLAGQQGYKKRIAHSDADYFNQNAKMRGWRQRGAKYRSRLCSNVPTPLRKCPAQQIWISGTVLCLLF